MENYSLYEKLNIYFPNKYFNKIEDSLDVILILANLKDYSIYLSLGDDNKSYKYAIIDIEQRTNKTTFILYLYYEIINNMCIFSSTELYYRGPHENEISKIFPDDQINNILDEIKKLI